MSLKNKLRKKYYLLRKKRYFEIDEKFFFPLIKFLKLKFKKKTFKLALYYPSNFELNVLKILENPYIFNKHTLLPIIGENYKMNFFSWKKNEVLLINKYGILEPIKSRVKVPEVILVPILVFDKFKFRIGYGKGFYDRYLTKIIKKYKKILTVGVAFSFQRYHKLPISKNDVKLDLILTDKGLIE
ncbi:5-formyltetrahydrofolate cyclo-ligase [Candidatus Pelagibacter bacterium]|nr:5-formyltetrahydrofolate cyclo-ligase [Candidatus Pelagibacter bacterium]